MTKTATVTRTYIQPVASQQNKQTKSKSQLRTNVAAPVPATNRRVISPQQRRLLIKALLIWLAFTVGGWQWLQPEYLPIFSHCVGFGFFLQLVTGKTRYLGILAASGALVGIFAWLWVQREYIVLFGNTSGYVAITVTVLIVTLCFNVQHVDTVSSIVSNAGNVNEVLDDIRNEVQHTFARVLRFVDSVSPAQLYTNMNTLAAEQQQSLIGSPDTQPLLASIQPTVHRSSSGAGGSTVQHNVDNHDIDADTFDLETQQTPEAIVAPQRARSNTDVDLEDIRALKVLIDSLKDALLVAERVSLDNKSRIDVLEGTLSQSQTAVQQLQSQLNDETHTRKAAEALNVRLQQQTSSSHNEIRRLEQHMKTTQLQHAAIIQIENDKRKLAVAQAQQQDMRYALLQQQYTSMQRELTAGCADTAVVHAQVTQLNHDNDRLQQTIHQLQAENAQLRRDGERQKALQMQRKVIAPPVNREPAHADAADNTVINQVHTPLHALFAVDTNRQSANSLFSSPDKSSVLNDTTKFTDLRTPTAQLTFVNNGARTLQSRPPGF